MRQSPTINHIPVQSGRLARLASFSSLDHHPLHCCRLLLFSHALHLSSLLKGCPAGPGCTCVVQQQRNRPKLLTALPLHFLPPSISTAATTTTSSSSSSLPLHCAVFPSCTGELFRMNCCQLKACYSCEIAITQCEQGSAQPKGCSPGCRSPCCDLSTREKIVTMAEALPHRGGSD